MEFKEINDSNYKDALTIIDIWSYEVNPDPKSNLGKKLDALIKQVQEYEKEKQN